MIKLECPSSVTESLRQEVSHVVAGAEVGLRPGLKGDEVVVDADVRERQRLRQACCKTGQVMPSKRATKCNTQVTKEK